MTERTEGYGDRLAELMSPEVARNPQPIYAMLHASTRRSSASTAWA